jgi:SPP1 gp7 family putative phage head morphogenesis protein
VSFSLISMLAGLLPGKRRKRKMRAVTPSHRAELNYLADLLLLVEQCKRAGADIAAGLRVHWDEFLPAADARTARDSVAPVPPGLDILLAQAARRFGNIEGVADRLAQLAAKRTLGAVDEALTENILRAIGVDISSYLPTDTEIGAALAEATTANVALIKSIPTQYLDGVRDTVSKAFAAGERWESVAARIQHVGDVTVSRAKLIARDQVSKMTSAFNEIRQVNVGITHYTWSTSHDERVRKSHQDLNGKDFAWKDPPEVDGEKANPGEPVNCRCVAIPVINLAEPPPAGAAAGETEERQAA